MLRPQPRPTLFPYTTLFRSARPENSGREIRTAIGCVERDQLQRTPSQCPGRGTLEPPSSHRGAQASLYSGSRSEEHTSELQSHSDLVCRLLLEKKKSLVTYT